MGAQPNARGSLGWCDAVRWALVVVLAGAVVVHVAMAAREFSVTGQAASFYAVNLAIDLLPALAYGAAVALAVTRRGGSVAWGVLLACGLALSAVVLFYLATDEFGELMLGPPCLVALCLAQMLAPVGSRTAEAR